MKSIGLILKQLRKQHQLTQDAVAKQIGVSRPSYVGYEKGTTAVPTRHLETLAELFGVSLDYLTHGIPPPASAPVRIPVLGYIRAGLPNLCDIDPIDWEEIPAEMAKSADYFALVVRGSSMEPRFNDGDVVIVRRQPDIESGEYAIVLIGQSEGTLKRVLKHEVGITLKPLNADYPTLTYTFEQIETLPVTIIGKVVELRAKF